MSLRLLRRMQVRVVRGSIDEPEGFADEIERADVIVHTVMDHDDPIGSDRKLLSAIADAPAPFRGTRHLIYTTGCSIYGPRPERVMDERTPGNDDHALAFRMHLEREAFALRPKLRVTVLRPGFMYGGDGHSCVAGQWFGMGLKGEALYRGDPDKGWSWVHVADLARAYRMVAETGRLTDGEVYCVADERRETCVAIMRRCLAAAGHDGDIAFAEADEDDKTSTWFDQNEFITSAKIRQHLGWAPHHAGPTDEADRLFEAWRDRQDAA